MARQENFTSGNLGALTTISVTGTAVQLSGGTCTALMVSAKQAITNLSGGASTDNADTILIGIGAEPSFATAYTGIPLRPGETITVEVNDSSMVYINGKSGDGVTFNRLF